MKKQTSLVLNRRFPGKIGFFLILTMLVAAILFTSCPDTVEYSTDELIDNGITSLMDGDFDKAVSSFEDAWKQDKNDPQAIVYSTLAKLASIAVDSKVKNLMQNRLGIKNYPGTLNKLLSPDWMETYTDEYILWGYYDTQYNRWVSWYDEWDIDDYGLPEVGYYVYDYMNDQYILVSNVPIYDETYDTQLPGLNVPSWFKDTNLYKDSFTSGNLQSTTTFSLLLAANLVDKNTNGLNALLDDLLDSCFGSNFEAAYDRAKTLTTNVVIDADMMEAFGLEEIFEGTIEFGIAEMKVLFAAIRIYKASLEWVTAYDWNTDLNFLKNGKLWDGEDTGTKPSNASLPLRNNFLKDRNNGRMANSKADFILAIDDCIDAYDLWIEYDWLPTGYIDTLQEYVWIQDGFKELKKAINNGTAFYIVDSSGSNTYNNSPTDALFGIDMGKFFTPGYLSIDKLIEKTGSGNTVAPVFYAYNEDSDDWMIIGQKTAIKDFDLIGFRLLTAPLQEIILGVDMPVDVTLDLFPPELAEIVWDWYH